MGDYGDYGDLPAGPDQDLHDADFEEGALGGHSDCARQCA